MKVPVISLDIKYYQYNGEIYQATLDETKISKSSVLVWEGPVPLIISYNIPYENPPGWGSYCMLQYL